jgi:hypothetical protein
MAYQSPKRKRGLGVFRVSTWFPRRPRERGARFGLECRFTAKDFPDSHRNLVDPGRLLRALPLTILFSWRSKKPALTGREKRHIFRVT